MTNLTENKAEGDSPSSTAIVRYALGWTFTVEEEMQMKKACQNANLFMEKFCRGNDYRRKPRNIKNKKYYE